MCISNFLLAPVCQRRMQRAGSSRERMPPRFRRHAIGRIARANVASLSASLGSHLKSRAMVDTAF
jgi:hypothetical protein